MSILTAPAPVVQTSPAEMTWGEACQVVASTTPTGSPEYRQALKVLRVHADRYEARYGTPEAEPTDTRDHAEPFEPSEEDREWYLGVVDHIGWPVDGELSPEEQDAELVTLDRYNDALEAMYADHIDAERIEAGRSGW